ncbi:hypothetical protein HY522_06980 [bacterium]|nr:hypothetical protein [bacterium]
MAEEPGPELLKAALGPTATLALWKYNSGMYSPEQFLSGLRNDLGWTLISEETLADPRFGRTHIGLYQKIGRLDEKIFNIRSCDFVLDGEIYMLVMSAPEAHFEASDTEFRKVFEGLSNMSGAISTSPLVDAVSPPPPLRGRAGGGSDLEAAPPSDFPLQGGRGEETLKQTFDYDLIYELPGGSRLGFQTAQKTADVIDPNGSVKATFPLSGVPYISSAGVHVLSDEYAYRIDPVTGNVTSRMPVADVLRAPEFVRPTALSPQPPATGIEQQASSIQHPASSNEQRASTNQQDSVKSMIQRASEIRGQAGVKPAIDYMMAQRGNVESSGSVHLYEFYFRLGEYWEETGDLETALAYYRLATKAID